MKSQKVLRSKKGLKKTKKNGGSIFIKNGVKKEEYILQKLAYDNNIPTVKPIKWENNILTMEKIDGLSVNDMYGDTEDGLKTIIEKGIMEKIRKIVKDLRDIGIIYPDITGYNFMIDNNTEKIYVIDFGHAFKSSNDFVTKFINEKKNEWNPDFL
tara:strand:+ start:37 stop:501 length:465 start_codon:yes stop_codon:yes gene_type:complete